MGKRIEVKYKGVVIGHTENRCKTIEFLDTAEALSVKDKLFNKGQAVGISSRAMDEQLKKRI